MPRSKDEELHQQRREHILAAAARVFKAKGFHRARTEDICAAADLSAGTVFRHFRDKREMIVAIAQIEFAHYRDEVRRLATREGLTWFSRIDADGVADLLRPKAFELGADSWLELARDPESRQHLLAFDSTLRATLAELLKQGQRAGWVRKTLDPLGACTLIFALFSGLAFDSETGAQVDHHATARALADLFGNFILSR